MNYFCITCLLLIISAVTYAEKGYSDEAIKRGDAYVDKLLEDMFENKVEEYDPYVLEDSVVGFNKKVMFVNVRGEAKLTDGYIKGLSTLHRTKHCSLQNEGDKLRVRADLAAGELELHYKGSAKFMDFGPTITIEGHLSYIEVFMEFRVNSKTGKEGRLTKFVIDDMRGMTVKVKGLGPLNWAVNPIISGVNKIFKRFIRNFMEHKVEKHIRERIPDFQFPVEDGEETEAPETIPPETEGPEETTPPDTLSPETETPEETPEPETEAPEETPEPEPETEAPEETPEPEPETEEPEPEPETEVPDETPEPEPETDAPEETPEPEPETDAPEETPEPEFPEEPDSIPIVTDAPEEMDSPKKPPSSVIIEEINSRETGDDLMLDESDALPIISELEELDSELSKESYY